MRGISSPLEIPQPVAAANPPRGQQRLGMDPPTLWLGAATASVIAGFVHLRIAGDHFDWWPASGWFFIAIGIVQVHFAITTATGMMRDRLAAWNVALNGLIISVFAVSRTVGLPFEPPMYAHGMKPGPGVPIIPAATLRIGQLDLVALFAEVAVIGFLVAALPEQHRRFVMRVLPLTAGVCACAWITTRVG